MANFKLTGQVLGNLNRINDTGNRLAAQENFLIKYLPIKQIRRSEKNFYSIKDIEALAESILLNGLQHNLVVREVDTDTYELISGERRLSALLHLVEQGHDLYELAPCKVNADDDVDAEIKLILANAHVRERSPAEIMQEVARLEELYRIKKERGEPVPGRVREQIANDLKLSPAQVGNYQNIVKNLAAPLKEEFTQGNMTIREAVQLAKLPEQQQEQIASEQKVKEKSVTATPTPPPLSPSPEQLQVQIHRKASTLQKTLDGLMDLLDAYHPFDDEYTTLTTQPPNTDGLFTRQGQTLTMNLYCDGEKNVGNFSIEIIPQ